MRQIATQSTKEAIISRVMGMLATVLFTGNERKPCSFFAERDWIPRRSEAHNTPLFS